MPGELTTSRGRRVARALARGALLTLAGALLLHVALPPWYVYPPATPFSGPRWHDPYAGPSGVWLRANTHAHSEHPLQIFSGAQSPAAVRAAYRDAGYDVYPLTNYHWVTPPGPEEPLYLPAYEHGWGLFKAHRTVLGARATTWLDQPLLPTTDGQQYLIDRLRGEAALVFLNHLNQRDPLSLGEMAEVCGYHAVEVRTNQARAYAFWDAALSAGRLVWGVCADDLHDLEVERDFQLGWTLIHAEARTPEAVLEALRRGRFYSVASRSRERPNALVDVGVRAGALEVTLAEPADELRFVGQGGRTLLELEGVASARYELAPEDTYVRVEAETRGTQLFTNPVFRHEGEPLARAALRAEVSPALSWLRRAALLALWLALAAALLRQRGSREAGGETAGEQRNST